MIYNNARSVCHEDLERMFELRQHPGETSVGMRSTIFSHPFHTREVLNQYYSIFPDGMFVCQQQDQILSFVCTIRTSGRVITRPLNWREAVGQNELHAHKPQGDWLYVSRLLYTVDPGHWSLVTEIGDLLGALKQRAVELGLKGVCFAGPVPGRSYRLSETARQKHEIHGPQSSWCNGCHPVGIARSVGFRHILGLPHYFERHRHFALMIWRTDNAI